MIINILLSTHFCPITFTQLFAQILKAASSLYLLAAFCVNHVNQFSALTFSQLPFLSAFFACSATDFISSGSSCCHAKPNAFR